MRTHLSRFERHVFHAVDNDRPSRMRPTAITGHTIRPRQVTFARAGHVLRGWLHLPPGDGPFPCVITNHGSGINQSTEDTSRPGTAALLMSWGIASLLPHRRGYGNSEGPAWRAEVLSPSGTPAYDAELSRRLDAESDDILAALDVVATLPEIDAKHIAVMGSSFGGVTTLLAASKTDRFTCAIDFAGAAMNWDKAPALRALMRQAALRLHKPLFLIQAANDYSIRPTLELAEALAGSRVTYQSHVYPDFGVNHHEGHLLESRGPVVWAEDVHRFLERYL
jgi:dipeptidyl aminopeptidase/acylaminoacyl peptidase